MWDSRHESPIVDVPSNSPYGIETFEKQSSNVLTSSLLISFKVRWCKKSAIVLWFRNGEVFRANRGAFSANREALIRNKHSKLLFEIDTGLSGHLGQFFFAFDCLTYMTAKIT